MARDHFNGLAVRTRRVTESVTIGCFVARMRQQSFAWLGGHALRQRASIDEQHHHERWRWQQHVEQDTVRISGDGRRTELSDAMEWQLVGKQQRHNNRSNALHAVEEPRNYCRYSIYSLPAHSKSDDIRKQRRFCGERGHPCDPRCLAELRFAQFLFHGEHSSRHYHRVEYNVRSVSDDSARHSVS